MTLQNPFIITPRLMAGLQIGKAFISMGAGPRNAEGRTEYGCYIDLPDGTSHEVTDLRSGCQGGDLQSGFSSLLSFLGAAAESYQHTGEDGENSDLFPLPVTQWAADNSDEISMLQMEIEETSDLIMPANQDAPESLEDDRYDVFEPGAGQDRGDLRDDGRSDGYGESYAERNT